jgi:biotin carboxyl carrier protein
MSKYAVTIDGQTFEVELGLFPWSPSELTVTVNGQPVVVAMPPLVVPLEEVGWLVVGDRPYEITVDPQLRWLRSGMGLHQLEVRDLEAVVSRPHNGDGRIKAPIPGLITRVLVSVGQSVESGQPLLTLEAMKMENEIQAPFAGQVRSLHARPGQPITRDALLVEIV